MRKYLIILEKPKTGYSAYVPDLPGCAATGSTKLQVEKLIYDSIEFHLGGLKEFKQPIPKNETEAYSVLVPVR